MASQKQIDANRRNAQHSTGPRTDAGKAKSRLNAIRDNITGQIITLSDQDRPIFEQLMATLIGGFNPQTPMEHKLAHDIAWDTWRLDHIRAIEMNVYALGLQELEVENIDNPGDDPNSTTHSDDLDTALADARTFRHEAKRFELMSLYEQRMNRSMHRNLATLRDLQAERKRNYEREKQEEITIARLHEYNELPIKASSRPSKSGFIYSDEEIAIGAVRERYIHTATHLMKQSDSINLYGSLSVGLEDSLLTKVTSGNPLSPEERKQRNSVPLEVKIVDRLNNPEQYGVRKS